MIETGKRKFYLKQFRAISHAISTYKDLNMLIDHITEGVSRAFKAKGSCVLLLDEREKELFIAGSYGLSDMYLNKGRIFLTDKHSSFIKGEPVYIDDVQNDPRVQYQKEAADEGIVSALSLPIKYRDTTIGVIRLYHSEPLLLHEEDVESLVVLAEHLGVVIENNGLKNFIEGLKAAMESLPPRILEGVI